MRILIATPLYPPDDGGPATYSHTLERALPKAGIEVSVVSFSHFRKYPKGLSHLLYYFALLRAAKKCDLIFALDPVSVGFPAMHASKRTGKPLVLKMVGDYAWEQGTQRFGVKENLDEFVKLRESEVREAYPKLMRLWHVERKVAAHATKVITPSVYLQRVVVDGWNILGEKVEVVYNSFRPNLPTESKQALRKELHMAAPTVISVGRFVPWKGFKALMDAVAEVRKTIPNVVLEIIGSGDSSDYEAYADKQGYSFAEFKGLLGHNELMRRIKAADCFALNTGYEGLSHVILEAMALETPVVTTNVGGNPELFAPWSKLALAEYNNADDLAGRIRLYVDSNNNAAAEKDAKSASAFVASFTEERMISETATLLKTIV